jgi:hypothetical protein
LFRGRKSTRKVAFEEVILEGAGAKLVSLGFWFSLAPVDGFGFWQFLRLTVGASAGLVVVLGPVVQVSAGLLLRRPSCGLSSLYFLALLASVRAVTRSG